MDVMTSHSDATVDSDQSGCISSQPIACRPSLLQCAGQHGSLETHTEVDVQINMPHCNVINNVNLGVDKLPRAAPPPLAPTNQKHLSSSKSHTSNKTNSTLIEEVARDDCCVHCLLACLFCNFQSMCGAVERCVTCGGGLSGSCGFIDTCCWCCCCCCWDEACVEPLDCGIVEECCSSADCLEMCLECCAICFPS
ncbi:myoD family inhibitor [Syngnathus acus]|uniref:myoD family inhibitor n=1 Tax=Syngnathus acus TaxID=161584 RepID=UPI001886138A|nr:myoD family inhibitor [Syngnathus acus]